MAHVQAPKKPSQREVSLGLAKLAGYHNDSFSFARAYTEARVSYSNMLAAWREGVKAKKNGVPCGCFECKRSVAV